MSNSLTKQDFIMRANLIHGEKYNYDNFIYNNNLSRGEIECPFHGIFKQIAGNHLQGQGCPKCANIIRGKKKTAYCQAENFNIFITNANILFNNKYNYSEFIYVNFSTKGKIICKIHGEFWLSPQQHVYYKKECDTCIFLEKATKIHGKLYDYSKSVYKKSKEKIIITCKIHGDFIQLPLVHLNTIGCPKCGYESIGNKLRTPIDEFIIKATQIYGDIYDYSQFIYKNKNAKSKIICKIHGEFFKSLERHLANDPSSGCPNCKIIKDTEKFIQEATIIHNGKYKYNEFIYTGWNKLGKIICDIHGIFEQNAHSHINGSGCQKCSRESSSEKQRGTLEDFIEKANKIHSYKYDYSLFDYKEVRVKGIIICNQINKNGKIHGEFLQSPQSHTSGSGCPKCSHLISKSEKSWLDSLGLPDDPEHRQVKLPEFRFKIDGYDPDTKTCYEMYGDFYHGNKIYFSYDEYNEKLHKTFGEIFQKTIEKENKILDAGYNLIYIWESEFDPVVAKRLMGQKLKREAKKLAQQPEIKTVDNDQKSF